MNLNQLRYFVAAAGYRSFTKAADQYFISQTAITQQIRSLEETIGCSLFDRSTRPLSLTPAGEVFLVDAKAIIERMNTAMQHTKEASQGLAGSLYIGYTKGYERSDLSVRLKEFHEHYAGSMLYCYRDSTDALAGGLLSGDYDLIYSWDSTNLCQDERVDYRLIEKARLVVAMYARHPFASKKYLRRSELAGERILFMSPSAEAGSYGDARFLEMYQQAGFQPDIIFRTSDIESALMMVASEMGICILPDYSTRKLIDAENLCFVPLVGEGETEEIIAAWRRDNQNPLLRRYLDFISGMETAVL